METNNRTNNLKMLALDISTAILSFFAIIGTSAIADRESRRTFLAELRMGDIADDRFFGIWSFVFLVFIIFSVVRTTYSYRPSKKAAFLSSHEGELSFSKACLSVLQAVSFWAEFAVISSLIYILPMEAGLCHVADTFFGTETEMPKLLTWLVFLPILFLCLFINYLGVHREWKQKREYSFREKKESKWKPFLMTAVICGFYAFASMIFPYLVPMAISVWGILQAAWVEILIGIVALSAVVTAFVDGRALLKQRSFMKKLRRLCTEKGFLLTEVQSVYGSIIRSQKGYNFTVTSGGREYRCKVVAGKRKNSPLAFTEKGIGLYQRTVRIFKWEFSYVMRTFDCAFESEETKVIILLPSPRKFFVGTAGAKLRLADTGDMAGDYQIFSAQGFLGALERDCIGVCRA